MFVGSASYLQGPYGARDKSASAILGVVKYFAADMEVPRAFRTDNGAEYISSTFVDNRNGFRIRRELTDPHALQQNGSVESELSRDVKAGQVARLEVNNLFPDIHLVRLNRVRNLDGLSLWIESVLWASEGFNRSARTANSGMLSPHEVFYGGHPPMPGLPFCKPAYHCVLRQRQMNPRARPCFVPELQIQWKRLIQDYGRGDGGGHALARRHMVPAAGTAYFP